MADDLLQMFQSITTSDHDELVDQFAHLLQLDVHTASFFLESCNWNVETAVNNYLATMEATSVTTPAPPDNSGDLDMDSGDDAAAPAPPPPAPANSAAFQAQFVSDLSASQNTLFAPEMPVHMQWTFVNSGTEPWPADTCLVFTQGDNFDGPMQIAVAAAPAQRIDVHAPLRMPAAPGSYAGSWRLRCSQGFFGDPVWVILNVGTHAGAAALQQQTDPNKLHFRAEDGDRQAVSSSTAVEDMDL